jgi:two-component system, cell cycle response regulator
MRHSMEDPRLVVAVSGGLAALAAGALGVATSTPVLAVVAGVAGVIAAVGGVALAGEARRNGDQLGEAEDEIRSMRRELASINAVLQEESTRRAAEIELGPTRDIAREHSEHAFDPATGLYDERYFAVLVQQHVAAARRSLRPVSVVIFEIDSMGEADADTRQQALGVVGDVVRRTLRESDAACRLGDLMIGAILEDTPEAGAVWAAERVRGTLLASPIGDALTLSAGVACYPTHALGAAELVHQSSCALDEARSRGRDRVELAPEAS